ncbi:MAG: hypothetical protein ACON4C_10805 [Henriciella sp.]
MPERIAMTETLKSIVRYIIASALLFLPLPASAQAGSYTANVRGLPMHCTSYYGEPVLIVSNPELNNVGVAHRIVNGQPVIQLNPNVTHQFSALVAQWWFLHECAHHALAPQMNSETNADCFSIRQLRDLGLLVHPAQIQEFYYQLRNLPGSSSGHLPGPMRVEHMRQCLAY